MLHDLQIGLEPKARREESTLQPERILPQLESRKAINE